MIELGLTSWLTGVRTTLLTEFFGSITALGSFTVAVAICGAIYLINRKTAFKVFTGVLAASVTTQVLKLIFKAPRPAVEHLAEVSTYSFPSGHTTVAFALAATLSEAEEELKYYLFGLAAVVGLSRMYLGVHFLSDVIAGAAVGITVPALVLRGIEKYGEPYLP